MTVAVSPAARLRGVIHVPGDKSITHRGLLLGAIAAGRSELSDASDSLDCRRTAACLRALGVHIERTAEGRREPDMPSDADEPDAVNVRWIVRSDGPGTWRVPEDVLDCGNSGTTLRLLCGLLAWQPGRVVLDGDGSLRSRPVARIIDPLRRMGATVSGRADDTLPPVTVVGRRSLQPIDHRSAVPSAQVKSAVLLAGLGAEGRTIVRESVQTRDHTERMLEARGVPVHVELTGEASCVSLDGGSLPQPRDERVPGDLSAAAFWLVAGAIHADADISLPGVGVNATRRAVIDVLRSMGASISESAPTPASEPVADLRVTTSDLHAVELGPSDVVRAIDEVPALCVAAAFARGTSRFRGVGELRRKETDRVAGIAAGLAALGARVAAEGDDLVVHGAAGRRALHGGSTDARGDHRLAMAFAVAGLALTDRTTIAAADSASVSYPGFFRDLAAASAARPIA